MILSAAVVLRVVLVAAACFWAPLVGAGTINLTPCRPSDRGEMSRDRPVARGAVCSTHRGHAGTEVRSGHRPTDVRPPREHANDAKVMITWPSSWPRLQWPTTAADCSPTTTCRPQTTASRPRTTATACSPTSTTACSPTTRVCSPTTPPCHVDPLRAAVTARPCWCCPRAATGGAHGRRSCLSSCIRERTRVIVKLPNYVVDVQLRPQPPTTGCPRTTTCSTTCTTPCSTTCRPTTTTTCSPPHYDSGFSRIRSEPVNVMPDDDYPRSLTAAAERSANTDGPMMVTDPAAAVADDYK